MTGPPELDSGGAQLEHTAGSIAGLTRPTHPAAASLPATCRVATAPIERAAPAIPALPTRTAASTSEHRDHPERGSSAPAHQGLAPAKNRFAITPSPDRDT